MGSLPRFPYFNPSLSLPSIPHLRSPDSPVHRHLIPPPLKSRRVSAHLHPFPNESLTELEFETLNPGPHRPSSGHANQVVADSHHTEAKKSCALCRNLIPDHVEPCTFPETAPAAVAALNPHIPMSTGPRIFCYACWVWIHNLSICWTCGETVLRKEERVSYGWCWWHWGCVSCLFCRTPMPPPPWTNNPSGIPLQTAPICKYCAEDLTVLEEVAPPTRPQTPPTPSSNTPFRPVPKWMAKLPSSRAKKTAPSCPILTHTPPPSPPSVHLFTDLGVPSHVEPSAKGLLLTRSLSANVQAKALLGHKASSAAITRMKSLKRKYGDREPRYMRELSAVFSDHRRKEDLRSRTKTRRRRGAEGGDDGEQEGMMLIHGHGWEDGGGRDLSLDKEEEEGSEEELGRWGVGLV